jgi:hypothetical protein
MESPLRAVPESAAAERAEMAEEQRTFEEFFRGEHDRLFLVRGFPAAARSSASMGRTIRTDRMSLRGR